MNEIVSKSMVDLATSVAKQEEHINRMENLTNNMERAFREVDNVFDSLVEQIY